MTALELRHDFVVNAAAELFDVPRAAIERYCQVPAISRARQASMLAMRVALGLSLKELGQVFHRDHKTVHKSCRRAVSDPRCAVLIERVKLEFPRG